jgi:hypothetical protein
MCLPVLSQQALFIIEKVERIYSATAYSCIVALSTISESQDKLPLNPNISKTPCRIKEKGPTRYTVKAERTPCFVHVECWTLETFFSPLWPFEKV